MVSNNIVACKVSDTTAEYVYMSGQKGGGGAFGCMRSNLAPGPLTAYDS
jgi:hypothetical protein